jgi:hypothetical protein
MKFKIPFPRKFGAEYSAIPRFKATPSASKLGIARGVKAVPARVIRTEAPAVACIIQPAAFVIEGQVRVCDSSVREDTGIDPDLRESAA